VKTQQIISSVRMEPDAVSILTDCFNDLLRYIMENQGRLIQEEYENATAEYISLSKGL